MQTFTFPILTVIDAPTDNTQLELKVIRWQTKLYAFFILCYLFVFTITSHSLEYME